MTKRETEPSAPPATGSKTTFDVTSAGRSSTRAANVAALACVAIAWIITLPRLVPSTFGDHGTFISVAERLLAGDRLYVDVWDNKDPFFFVALALGRTVSPLGDIALEAFWVLVASWSTLLMARSAGADRRLALATGFGAIPLVLTGPAYEPGMTHLPGVALCLAVVMCAVRSRWVLAGVLVGLLLLTKLILAPIAAGALLVVALHRGRAGGTGLLGAIAGCLGLLLVGLGTMWLRGELPGWISNFALNRAYADGELGDSQYGSAVGHLLRAFPEDGRGAGTVTISAIALILIGVRRSWTPGWPTALAHEAVPDSGATPRTISPAVLWDLTLVSLMLSLAVLATTATWPHHAQTLSIPGALALALVATRLSGVIHGWRVLAVLLVAGYATAGALHPYFYLNALRGMPTSMQQLQRESPESAVLDSLPQVRTYARAQLQSASIPRRWYVATLPRTSAGKVARAAVRAGLIDGTLDARPLP